MEFLVKIKCSDVLKKQEIIEELRNGLHCLVGQSDPDDRFYQELEDVKISLVRSSRKK